MTLLPGYIMGRQWDVLLSCMPSAPPPLLPHGHMQVCTRVLESTNTRMGFLTARRSCFAFLLRVPAGA